MPHGVKPTWQHLAAAMRAGSAAQHACGPQPEHADGELVAWACLAGSYLAGQPTLDSALVLLAQCHGQHCSAPTHAVTRRIECLVPGGAEAYTSALVLLACQQGLHSVHATSGCPRCLNRATVPPLYSEGITLCRAAGREPGSSHGGVGPQSGS